MQYFAGLGYQIIIMKYIEWSIFPVLNILLHIMLCISTIVRLQITMLNFCFQQSCSMLLFVKLLIICTVKRLQCFMQISCRIVAALLHYFFLSAFCWMLCEAIMMYLLVIVVFSQIAKKWALYFIIGWGVPLIIVCITFGAFYDGYVNELNM